MRTLGSVLRARAARMARMAMIPPLLALGACSGYAPNYDLLAKGPSAEFNGQALAIAAQNQQVVVKQLSTMAGLDPEIGPQGQVQWKQFGIAALGRARLECNAYITEIMKVEEHRRTINQQLSLAGAATAGILGLSGAASAAIAITAIAFGLAQGTVDNVTTGLLYSLGAEPVQSMIANLRGAYTGKLTDASWQDRSTTFNTIYGYLELCTPVVLREKIKSAVATAPVQATAGDSQGSTPQVSIVTQQVITNPSGPLPPPVAAPPISGLAADERGILKSDIAAIQTALCVAPTGDPGGPPGSNSRTRLAIKQFLSGRGGAKTAPDQQNDKLVPGDGMTRLRDAVTEATSGNVVRVCADRGYLSPFEVGYLGGKGAVDFEKTVRFEQDNLNTKLGRAAGLDVDGKLETLRKTLGILNKTNMPTPLDYALFVQFN